MAQTIRRNQSGSLGVRLIDNAGFRITTATSITGILRRFTGTSKVIVSPSAAMTWSATAKTDDADPGYSGEPGTNGPVFGAWVRTYTAANVAVVGTYELEVNYTGAAGTFQEFYIVNVIDNRRD
jgi:hypothetical protein